MNIRLPLALVTNYEIYTTHIKMGEAVVNRNIDFESPFSGNCKFNGDP